MKIGILCSSKDHYPKETKEICEFLSEEKFDLVFGASSTGMMGICYDTFHEKGRKMEGATVKEYQQDLQNLPYAQPYICETTFDRIKLIMNLSDVILLLPGGTGTLSEFFSLLEEVRTIGQKGKLLLYSLPYKNGHYFDFIKEMMDRMIMDGYNSSDIKEYYDIIEDKEKLKQKILRRKENERI